MNVPENLRRRGRLMTVVAVTFLLAAAVTMQVKTELIPASNTVARDQALVRGVQSLEKDNVALRDQVHSISTQIAEIENRLGQSSAQARTLQNLTNAQRELAGLTTLTGPGIRVQLASGSNPHRANDSRLDWQIGYIDIQDVVNLLWASGAEAISVNHQRVVPTSSFYVAKPDVLLNGVHLTSPFTVDAIGDGSHLNSVLSEDGSLSDIKTRGQIYQIKLSWQPQRSLTLPAYDGAFQVRYALAGQ